MARGTAKVGRAAESGDDEGNERLFDNRRTDDADAFMDDPEGGPARIDDDLAETLAEEFIRSATTGEDTADTALDPTVPEEIGGPFIETMAADEFALGPDDSNPEDATAEPLPRAVHGLAQGPDYES